MSVFRSDLFKNKTAIVTGGGTGIGFAIARELLLCGGNVVICSRKADNLKESIINLKRQIGSDVEKRVDFCVVNTREEKSIKDAFEFTLKRFGSLQYLVNNAGGQFPSPGNSISANGWRTVIDLNLTGTFMCSKEAFHVFQQQGKGGAIVNITCDMENGFPMMSHTGAARAGVVNMTKSFAVEWASAGVRINCVSPGVIFTDSGDKHYKTQTSMPDVLQSAIPGIPAKRLGTADEISSCVLFLLSEAASYVTGINMQVDGGSRLTGPSPSNREIFLSDEAQPWKEYRIVTTNDNINSEEDKKETSKL